MDNHRIPIISHTFPKTYDENYMKYIGNYRTHTRNYKTYMKHYEEIHKNYIGNVLEIL